MRKTGLRPAYMVLFACTLAVAQTNPNYVPGPDSQPKPNVPQGRVEKFVFDQSKIFPGTTRTVNVYIPAQYTATKPAALMIFQDGSGFANPAAGSRAPVVLDNLIAEGSVPVAIGIFVDPGVTPALTPDQMPRFHRSLEYDGLGDKYARFLIEDLIPEVEKRYTLKISSHADDRALIGSSSGGIASFVAAWERPDAFHRVASFVGSFTNLRGGDHLSDLIRITEPKPLRIFLQDGSNDQSIYGGSWYQANQSMAASLEYAGYDVRFVVGTEGHSGHHGAAILPYVMRWLWREYPNPIVASKGGPGVRQYITEFLAPDNDWQPAAQANATSLAIDKEGAVYFNDTRTSKILKLGSDKAFAASPAGGGMMFGPDGRLYVGEPSRRRIVAFAPDGALKIIATDVDPADLAVTSKGAVYYADTKAQQIGLIDPTGKRSIAGHAPAAFSSLRLSPDQHLLDAADRTSRWVWSFEIAPDITLRYGMPFHRLEAPDESTVTAAAGMTLDNTGHLYVATNQGIQICDQAGRPVGIIRAPQPGPLNSVVFGGPGLQTLYAAAGDKIYSRKLRRTGVYPWQPAKLPRPQL